jgi:hypothetical protein
VLLMDGEPAQAMLAQEPMHRRAGDCHLMEPPQIVSDPAGAEVILPCRTGNVTPAVKSDARSPAPQRPANGSTDRVHETSAR